MEHHKYNEMSKLVIAVFDKYGHKDALNRLNSGIAKAPNLVEAYLVRGELYMELNDVQMALNDFEKAIMIDPNEPEAYFLRGLLYVNKGDIDKAINDFDKTIELDSNHADAYINRADLYLKKNLLQKASIDCTKAIELSPDRMEPYYYRGLAYSGFGGYTKALEDYNMAIGIVDESSDQQTDTFAKRRIAKSRSGNTLEAIRNAKLIHSMLEEAKSNSASADGRRSNSEESGRNSEGYVYKYRVVENSGGGVGSTSGAAPAMSGMAIAEFTVRRRLKLQLAIEAYFTNKGVSCRIGGDGTDGIIGNTWFEVGFACIFDCENIYISMRGYQARLESYDPRDIVSWIEDDYPLYAKLSYNDDIIAYQTGGMPMGDFIKPILEICNSMSN